MKLALTLVLTALLMFACTPKKEEPIADIVAAAPETAQLIFENDYVRAVEFKLQPGESLPLHKGGPRVVYALSDYRIMWTEGAQSLEKEWLRGQAHWHDAIDHAVENIGASEARYLVLTRHGAELPATGEYDLDKDAASAAEAHAQMVFDNEHVRVIEVKIPAGEAQPLHHGLNRLIYSLSDYAIKYTSDRMAEKEAAFAAGDAHWHGADEHAVANTGDTEAHFLIFEFKK
jgi:quercetin dioxygenase-like cupin family protein